MRIYVLLAVITVVSGIDFDVFIYDSSGNDITGSTSYNAWAGDYIYCKFDGDVIGTMIYYGWMKIDDGDGFNEDGPNFVSFPNEVDYSNRLYIGMTFGNGNPISYKCIASDVDPYENRDQFTGADIRFTVSQPPFAGELFPERDYAVVSGDTIDLLCKRMDPNARVLWQTTTLGGQEVEEIYDTDDGVEPTGDYELVGVDEDDFTLRVTMTEDTAIFTKCTVTYNTLTDVSATAMLFKLDIPNPCTAENLNANNDVGDLIELGDCYATVYYNENIGLNSDITTLSFWQESTNGENYNDFDTSRTIDGISIHTVKANLNSDGESFHCGIQVYREEASVIRAHVDSVCNEDFTLTVNPDTHAFNMYYGQNEVIDFDTLNTRKTEIIRDADLICDLEAKPEPSGADTFVIHVKAPGEPDFVATSSNVVLAVDIEVGAAYKCVFFDESTDEIHDSGILYIIEGIIQTAIYDNSGNLLDTTTVYDFNSGDFMECRPASGVVNEDHIPQYIWHRSIQVQNTDGPKQLRYQNTDDEFNRLPISYELGMGETIGYQCIGTDDLTIGLIDMMGTLVRFRAAITDASKAGTAFTPVDNIGFEGDEVQLACSRNAGAGRVVFETHKEDGGDPETIYDSNDPDTDPPNGYLIEVDGNSFILTVIINQNRAMLTRCVITEDPKDAVSATSMIYMIALVDQCTADDTLDGVDTGTMATLDGCDVNVSYNPDAGALGGTFTVMTYWQQSTTTFPNRYSVIDETRSLDLASTYRAKATQNTHNDIYTCGVQIHRENSLVVPATKNNLCDSYTVNVNVNSVGFRVYYGVRDKIDDDDYLTFDVLNLYLTEIMPNAAITCEYDRYPNAAPEDSITVEYMSVDSDTWQDHGSNIVAPDDIVIDTQYRCAFHDADDIDNNVESGIINFITGIIITELVDQYGALLEDNTNYQMTVGDYIVCRPTEPFNARYPPRYLWRRSTNSPTNAGPQHVQYKNEEDHTNRLYINYELGQGAEIAYRCIGTDDLSRGQPDLMGTEVHFSAVSVAAPAGIVFEAMDYAGLEGSTTSLTCSRDTAEGRVIWDTIDSSGDIVMPIYDSDADEHPNPDTGYEVNVNGNDYELVITHRLDTAILTRCIVNENGKSDVEGTSMIYLVELNDFGCDERWLSDNLPVGEEVIFSGCSVTTSISPSFGVDGITPYTTITFWQQSDAADGEYHVIESTRTLDGESIYTVPASAESDTMFYSCGVQVHREGILVVAAVASNICESPYQITVADNSVGFRVYYGVRNEMDDNDYIRFDTLDRYPTTKVIGGDLTCEIDRNPEAGDGHEVVMEFQVPDSEDWEASNNNVIPEEDINVGTKYRCAYVDPDSADNNAESGVVFIIQVMMEVEIYQSNGDPVVDGTDYEFVDGDYVECRSVTPFSLEYRPKFLWHRSNQVQNLNGPKQVRYQNTDDDFNRLPISMMLGGGETIQYRCIGADVIPSLGLEDFMGKPVNFKTLSTVGLDPAGTVFSPQEQVGMDGETVDLACSRNNGGGRVVWQTMNKEGDVLNDIYDSQEGGNAMDGYQIIDDSGDDFALRVTISINTAILTRCTVSENGLLTVTATTMIYYAERIEGQDCESDASALPSVGDHIRLSGCDANIHVSPDSGIVNDDYQAVMFWTQKLSGSDDFMLIDESRVLERESIYTIEALSELHEAVWQCGIQISRPQVLSTSVILSNVCIEEPTLQLGDNDVRFRVYYGDREQLEYDQFIDFPASAVDVGKTDGSDLTCEIDRHPAPANDDTFFMQSRNGDDGDWQDENDVIPANQVEIGMHYRCLYRDADGEDTMSPIIRMVEGLNILEEVVVYDSEGNPLDEDTVVEVAEGDFLECRPANNFATIAEYAWVKSIQLNALGPNIIQIPNEESGYNRLYVYNNFGEGEAIAYRCIAGTDFGWGFTELLGTKVQFMVIPSDDPPPGDNGVGSVQSSLFCIGAALVAYINYYLY